MRRRRDKSVPPEDYVEFHPTPEVIPKLGGNGTTPVVSQS